MRDLLTFCEAEQPWLRTTIETLAAIESPTPDKAAVDRCGREVARLMQEIGGEVTVIPQKVAGDHVCGRFGDGPSRVLLIGHFDTVWDVGTLSRMPIVERDGRLYGPGVFDMKAGLSIALQAIRALRHAGWPPGLEVVCLWTSDEETGSHTSRALGVELQEGATGGASDGNFTGAAGVPTLDGLGASGGGAHAADEHIEVAPLPFRAALAAGLLRRLSQ